MEESTKTPRLFVSFVADNSASMQQSGKMKPLMEGVRAFAQRMAENPAFSFELISFDTFAPAVVKPFDAAEIPPVAAGKFPLLGRAAALAATRLLDKVKEAEAAGEVCYRPWLFLLSDGLTFDTMDEVVADIEAKGKEGALVYLPFRLSPKLVGEKIRALDRTKHMIEITEGHVGDFFTFVSRMAAERFTLPAEESMKFSKSDFEGWALL